MISCALLCLSFQAEALQPPSAFEIIQYREDGTLDQRIAAAQAIQSGQLQTDQPTLKLDPAFANQTSSEVISVANALSSQAMPSTGNINVLALLIDFPDEPHTNSQANIDAALFGAGSGATYPYESLSTYYQRSSYGKLNIQGSTLGWYRSANPRSSISQTYQGRENLIKAALSSYNASHDFSQYDNNGDGAIDYLVVIWAGPKGDWATFWWGYQTQFTDSSYKLDGKNLGIYSWQWESYNPGTAFTPKVVIHETGHALGLPDLYDLDINAGPIGGVGGMDMMGYNWGDHNGYHKWLLGWVSPTILNSINNQSFTLKPLSEDGNGSVIVVFPNASSNPNKELFIVENRWRTENDKYLPNDGLIIWHVDGRQSNGNWLYNNTNTEHKYMRLMEADGKEEIESIDAYADADDFYTEGNSFNPNTSPSSKQYNGSSSNLWIGSIGRSSISRQTTLNLTISSPGILFPEPSSKINLSGVLLLLLLD